MPTVDFPLAQAVCWAYTSTPGRDPNMATADSKIATLLMDKRLLDQFQYRAIQDHQDRSGGRFHLLAMALGFVPEDRICAAVAKVTGLQMVSLEKLKPDPLAIAKLDGPFCAKHTLIPCALRDEGRCLWLAMADPIDGKAIADARRATGLTVRPLVGRPTEIKAHIERFYGSELPDGDPFSQSIDLSFSDDEAEQEDVFKVTDISGKTLVKHAGDARQEGSAAAKLAEERPEAPIFGGPQVAGASTPLADLALGVEAPAVSVDERLSRIAANQEKATRIIKALVELCIEKGFFSAEEFSTNRKA
jgi:hypothetical protein